MVNCSICDCFRRSLYDFKYNCVFSVSLADFKCPHVLYLALLDWLCLYYILAQGQVWRPAGRVRFPPGALNEIIRRKEERRMKKAEYSHVFFFDELIEHFFCFNSVCFHEAFGVPYCVCLKNVLKSRIQQVETGGFSRGSQNTVFTAKKGLEWLVIQWSSCYQQGNRKHVFPVSFADFKCPHSFFLRLPDWLCIYYILAQVYFQ